LCLYVLTKYCTVACLHHLAGVNGLSVILRWLKLAVDVDCMSLLCAVLGFFCVLPMDEQIITFIKTHKIGGKINKLLKHTDVDVIRSAQKAKDCIQEKLSVFGTQAAVGTAVVGVKTGADADSASALPTAIMDIDRYLRTVKMDAAKAAEAEAAAKAAEAVAAARAESLAESAIAPEPARVLAPVESLESKRSRESSAVSSKMAPVVAKARTPPAASLAPALVVAPIAAPVVRKEVAKSAPSVSAGSPVAKPAAAVRKAFGSGIGSLTGDDGVDNDDDDDDSVISFTGFNKFKRTAVSMGASLAANMLSGESAAAVLAPVHSRTAVPEKSILKKTEPISAEDSSSAGEATAKNALDIALDDSDAGVTKVSTGRSIFWADHGPGAKATTASSSGAGGAPSPTAAGTSAAGAASGELTKVYTYEIDTLFRRKIAGYQSTKEREKTERLRMKEDAKKKFVMVAELTPAEWERPKPLLVPSFSEDDTDSWESAFAIPETDSDCKLKENLRLKTVLEERYYSGKPVPMDPARPMGANSSLKGPEHSQELVMIPFDIVTAGVEQVPAEEPVHAPAADAVDADTEGDSEDLSAMMEQLPELIRNLDSSILQYLIAHEDDLVMLLSEDGSVDEEKVRQYVANFYAQRGGGPPPVNTYGSAYGSGAPSSAIGGYGRGGGGSYGTGNVGQKRERELCSYFNTKAGCMRGDDCRYMHVVGVAPKRQKY
jgi:hypothetical protein